MAWKEVESGAVFQFEKEGDSIEGELVDTVEGQFGNNYIIKTPSGEEMTVFGKTVINTKMARIKKGQKVKITFKGEVKAPTSGRNYQDYSIEVDE